MKADRNLKLNMSCNVQRAQRHRYHNNMCIIVLIICDYTVSTYIHGRYLLCLYCGPLDFKSNSDSEVKVPAVRHGAIRLLWIHLVDISCRCSCQKKEAPICQRAQMLEGWETVCVCVCARRCVKPVSKEKWYRGSVVCTCLALGCRSTV